MPFPSHAVTIQGGCNCKSIRYKISIPSSEERPLFPGTSGKLPADKEVRLPLSYVCHCNDCRTSSGALLNYALLNALDWVSISSTPSPSSDGVNKGPYIPATQIFTSSMTAPSDSNLAFYKRTPNRVRAFCKNCGTHIFYFYHPLPEGWTPAVIDVWMGTLDREDLEKGWMRLQRSVWVEKGVEWVNELVSERTGGLPKHPGGDVTVDL